MTKPKANDKKVIADESLESAIIGGILRNKDMLYECEPYLKPEDFYFGRNKVLYSVLSDMIVQGDIDTIDTVSVIRRVKELGYDDKKIETLNKYIEIINERPISEENFKAFSIKVKQLSLKRNLKSTLESTANTINDDGQSVVDTLNDIEANIFNFSTSLSHTSRIVRLGKGAVEHANELADNPRETIGFPTDYKIYSDAIGGLFRRSTVNVVAARAKTGKSYFVLNLAYDQAKRGIPCLIVDSELTEEDQKNRLLSRVSGVDINLIETGKWRADKETKNKIIKSKEIVDELPIYFVSTVGEKVESSLSLIRNFLNTIVKRGKNGKYNDCAVFYDYLKITDENEVKGDLKEYQVIGFAMQKLRQLALNYDIPLIVVVQSNRDGLKSFTEGSVSQSDRINWLATSLAFFVKKTEDEITEYGSEIGHRKLYVAFSHHGPGLYPGDFIHLRDNFPIAMIEEVQKDSSINTQAKSILEKKKKEKVDKQKRLGESNNMGDAENDEVGDLGWLTEGAEEGTEEGIKGLDDDI